MPDIPRYEPDIYAEEAQSEPYGHYRTLRDLGPVVHLVAHDMIALPRYAGVRAALGDPGVFCSGQGVAMNDIVNDLPKNGLPSTLMSDGELHDHLRRVMGSGLTPRSLRPRRAGITAVATEIIDAAVARGSFDGVADVARAVPLSVVPDLVGWPTDGREHLLDWAAAAFDSLGPLNARTMAAGPRLEAMFGYANATAAAGSLLPGSVGAAMLAAAERGEIQADQVPTMVVDYIAPSLDTTISAIGSALWLLGTHPEQYAAMRADRRLVASAFEETIRLETPIRSFTRVTTTAVEIDGYEIEAGTRVIMMYASANRDERHYVDADQFDITRNATDHVGFGHGTHGCAGQGLARLEGHAVLNAFADRVDSFEVGEPVRGVNNLIRSLAALPVTITAVSAPAAL